MRSRLMFGVVLSLASAAYAKDSKPFQSGTLMQMDSVECVAVQKDAQSLAAEAPGLDEVSKNTHEQLCQEYVVQSESVTYRIRPRDQKHPPLLPVGQQAQFRLQNDKMLLRVEDLDDPYRNNPERRSEEGVYIVISMTPRSDSSTADSKPLHLNHLQ